MAYAFLLLVGVWIPFLAWRSSRKMGDGPIPLSRRALFGQVIATQVFLAAVGLWTAHVYGIPVWDLPPHPVRAWAAAAAFFVALIATLRFRWKSRPQKQKERLYSMLPHDRRELAYYLLVAFCAGVGEEIVYRRVLTGTLWYFLDDLYAAAALSALAFALAHIVQGWRAVMAIFVIAIASQWLVQYSGSLIPMMAVHAGYDLVAGIVIPRWYERDRAATSSLPIDAAPEAGR